MHRHCLPLLLAAVSAQLLSLPAAAIELSAEEQAFLVEHPKIVVGGEMDWPPMDFAEDGVHTGAANDYLKEIARITGIELDVITGYTWSELLAMLRAREIGNVSPDEFVPIAEEFGLVVEMGEWVLRKACQALRYLDAEGCHIDSISISTSTVEFLKGDIASRYAAILDDCEIDKQRIEIEITERYMLENDQDAETEFHELRRLGHTIAVDDFGTGYSSLSYKERLPLNTIKIDRSCIQNLPYDDNDVEILQAIISLSRSLGYKVVAESVETREQLDFLLERSCNYAQGYLFSAPVPLEQVSRSAAKIDTDFRIEKGWISRLRILRV